MTRFCENCITSGIDHIPRSKKDKERKKDEKVCTIKRVDISKCSSYCRLCYRSCRNHDTMKESSMCQYLSVIISDLGAEDAVSKFVKNFWESYDHK